MDIRPEIHLAFKTGKAGFLDKKGARLLSESIDAAEPIMKAVEGTRLDILALTGRAMHLFEGSTRTLVKWPLGDIRDVSVVGRARGRCDIEITHAVTGETKTFRALRSEDVGPLLDCLRQLADSPVKRVKSFSTSSTNLTDGGPIDKERRASTRKFEIHTLGPSGSGKTVFMASMYQRLRLRRPELAFYLKSDHDSSVYLNTAYNMIANPTESWPEASRGVQEWRFTSCFQTPSGDFEPLEFRYLDYPGGILTNPRGRQDASIQDLVSRLKSANALLILLDGLAVKALMEGDPRGRRYMEFDITSSLEIAQQSRCPVHFVVTKWDLLAKSYTLSKVRDRLMEDENLRDLVLAKKEDTPAAIRLFPVSAVGFGFAQLDKSGDMRKLGSPMRPHNVELPLLSVLPDFLQFAYDELVKQEPSLSNRGKGRLQDLFLNERVQDAFQSAGKRAAGTALTGMRTFLMKRYPALMPLLADSDIEDALGFGERLLTAQTDRLRVGREAFRQRTLDIRQEVDSQGKAMELLERQCIEVIATFEELEPASTLAGGLSSFETSVRRQTSVDKG